MLCKIRFYSICIFLCGISLISFGSTEKADSLFDAGNYFQASIEFEHAIFYTADRDVANVNRYKKALCYKNMADYSKAIDELQSIYIFSITDTLFTKVNYQLALCYYINNQPVNAIWKIEEFINRTKDSVAYIDFIPLKVLCHNELQEWNKAKHELQFLIEHCVNDDEKAVLATDVEKMYSKKSLPRMLKVKHAENLSRFIPGSGQMYAGKVGEGTVNLLINASLLAFAAHQFYYRYYLTGYFAGLGMFNKVYHGGIKRAGILAAEANNENIKHFNQEINNLLIHVIE